ncbi:MAG: hypothetical protein RL660_2257 [Bacteroidota bacterium]|jgi:uncharacterized damage-inducible protein DinB
MKSIKRPSGTEHALYYDQYLQLIPDSPSILDQMKLNAKQLIATVKLLSEEQLLYRYQAEKWCIKDILVHMLDVERVMCYRAMRFCRQDKTALSFFDENAYAVAAQAHKLSINKILKEYDLTRKHTLAFFNNLNAKQLTSSGVASNTPTSVRALAWIICGHEKHHMNVMAEKYNVQFLNIDK